MAAIPQYMRNGEGIRFIAEEMGLDNEPEPVAYHSCGFNTKSACTRLITPSFDSIQWRIQKVAEGGGKDKGVRGFTPRENFLKVGVAGELWGHSECILKR